MNKKTFKEELEKLRKEFKSDNALYSSALYKEKYPELMKLYQEEGLGERRKNLLRNRRRLKKMGMEAMFAVK